jgi:hypothetical protein
MATAEAVNHLFIAGFLPNARMPTENESPKWSGVRSFGRNLLADLYCSGAWLSPPLAGLPNNLLYLSSSEGEQYISMTSLCGSSNFMGNLFVAIHDLVYILGSSIVTSFTILTTIFLSRSEEYRESRFDWPLVLAATFCLIRRSRSFG